MTLDLLSWSPRISVPREDDSRPSIEARFTAFRAANPHVFAELLRLAREHLDRGVPYIAVKKLWEECRVSLRSSGDGGFNLNNDFTSLAARWLIESDPRLASVIRLRRRKRE